MSTIHCKDTIFFENKVSQNEQFITFAYIFTITPRNIGNLFCESVKNVNVSLNEKSKLS